ncbi:MAG: molybdenum cofactor guanylyltransferase, partial [Burkholderiales bacterium]|nr:molybdenum cofactor guanylyltransferase [Burkholderiales bacterium]
MNSVTVKITGVILAGGQGRRMGGVDKGLRVLRGRPMVQWVIERFAPQVDEVLVNANQNLGTYAGFGYRVIPDRIGGFAGPLAGLQRGLVEARHDLVATVPCDSPFLPHDLIARLYSAVAQHGAEVAVAKTGNQPHPVFCLCRKRVLPG